MKIAIWLFIASLASGVIFTIIDAVECNLKGQPTNHANTAFTFSLGFFLWPILLPIVIVYGIVKLIDHFFIGSLNKLVNRLAGPLNPGVEVKADKFTLEAKKELKEFFDEP